MDKKVLDSIENFEIVRSFSQKKNLGNYETQDYFASYKANVKPDTPEEDLQAISDIVAEKAENDVISKVDPTKFVSRQVTLAEYRAKLKSQEERIKTLEEQLSKEVPF